MVLRARLLNAWACRDALHNGVQSSGSFLCFLDADDVMLPHRVRRQLSAALEHPRAIIGAGFVKIPAGATEHYAAWANTMNEAQVGPADNVPPQASSW